MKFTLYSKEGCSYCEKAKRLLDLAKVEYRVYKLDTDFTKQEFYAEFGEGATFPQVQIDNKHIGGCKDTLHYLQEQGII